MAPAINLELELKTAAGESVMLATLIDRPFVLIFLRHLT
jgi:hypothetical protein